MSEAEKKEEAKLNVTQNEETPQVEEEKRQEIVTLPIPIPTNQTAPLHLPLPIPSVAPKPPASSPPVTPIQESKSPLLPSSHIFTQEDKIHPYWLTNTPQRRHEEDKYRKQKKKKQAELAENRMRKKDEIMNRARKNVLEDIDEDEDEMIFHPNIAAEKKIVPPPPPPPIPLIPLIRKPEKEMKFKGDQGTLKDKAKAVNQRISQREERRLRKLFLENQARQRFTKVKVGGKRSQATAFPSIMLSLRKKNSLRKSKRAKRRAEKLEATTVEIEEGGAKGKKEKGKNEQGGSGYFPQLLW